MERLLNSSVEKQTIYEIFRACRLCGGGAGYKMPIIQNVVDLDSSEVELKHKIKECVQIEVHQDDKMPPLICELCVDKVNDFFEFLDMCRQVNKHTRLRLGLPPQTTQQESPAAEDCILGVTEPVYVNDSDEPLSKQKSKTKPNDKGKKEETVKPKNEPELRVKVEKHIPKFIPAKCDNNVRLSRSSKRLESPRPKGSSDNSIKTHINNDDISLALLKAQKRLPRVVITKGILKNENKVDEPLLVPRLKKRLRAKTPPKPNEPSKKVKLSLKPEPPKPVSKHSPRVNNKPPPRPILRSSLDSKTSNPRASLDSKSSSNSRTSIDSKNSSTSRTSLDSKTSGSRISLRSVSKPDPKVEPKPPQKQTTKAVRKPSPKQAPKRPASPPPLLKCTICKQQIKMPQNLTNHMKCHTPSFTSDKLACNACQDWFRSPEETAAHHKRHSRGKRYHCTRCFSDFNVYQGYLDHIKETCIPLYEVPDVQCHECWHYFPTDNLRDQHDCPGEDGRPGGKCEHCKRNYATLKSLTKHKGVCSSKKKVFVLDPVLKSKLRPVRVRTARCDPLLVNSKNDQYNVSHIDQDFGFDKTCVYPFRFRSQPKFQGMVKFNDDFDIDNMYVHWDSEDSEGSSDTEQSDTILSPFIKRKIIDKLSTLSLKTIFSHRFLGKVPRKRRKLKLFETHCDTNGENVDKIIENLDKQDQTVLESDDKNTVQNKSTENIDKAIDVKESDDTSLEYSRNYETMKENKTGHSQTNKTKIKINADEETEEENGLEQKTVSVADESETICEALHFSSHTDEKDQYCEKNNTSGNENDEIITDTAQASSASKNVQDTSPLLDDERKRVVDQDKEECKKVTETDDILIKRQEEIQSNTSHVKQLDVSVNKNDDKNCDSIINNSETLIDKGPAYCTETKTIQNQFLTYDNDNVSKDKSAYESNKREDSDREESDHTELNQSNGEIKTTDTSQSSDISKRFNSNTNENKCELKSSVSNITKTVETEVKDKHVLESEKPKHEVHEANHSVCDVRKDEEKISSDISKVVNGEPSEPEEDDECDIEMDDKKLMEEIDAQIGENYNSKNDESEKSQTECEVLSRRDQSDLETVSDDEINF